MKTHLWLILFTMLSFLTSCQVKEGEGSKGLISGHKPTENAFTLQTPVSGTYIAGDTLNLVLTFPYPVTVTGAPRLQLRIGSNTRYATLNTGDGTKTLSFSYTITGTDNDRDGVEFKGIDLNGGSLTFDDKGTTTNCSTTLDDKTFTNVLVDTDIPKIDSAFFSNAPNYYKVGSSINVTVKFTEKVYVTGQPRLQMTTNRGDTIYAIYASGSGSDSLVFTYIVTDTVRHNLAANIVVATSIDLNGGTIKDAVNLDADRNFSAAQRTALQNSSSVFRFNGRMPILQNIIVPTPGQYPAGSTLEFILEYDRPVTVTTAPDGSPSLPLLIGPNGTETITRYANYYGGSGTSTLTFRYALIPGDADTDGPRVVETAGIKQLRLTSPSTIQSQATSEPFVNAFTIFQNHALSVPDLSNIILNSIQPAVQSVVIEQDTSGPYGTSGSDEFFKIGEPIFVTVNFNDQMIVTQDDGVPSLPLNIGGVIKEATYLSGGDGQTSLIFKYIVEEGLEDLDGIELGPAIKLNDGVITNKANTNAVLTLPTMTFANRKVDGIRPKITGVNAPAAGTYSAVESPVKNLLDFPVQWSEPVEVNNINLPIVINVTNRNATYFSGNQTNTTTFRYSIVTGDTSDTNGITVGSSLVKSTGTIYDAHGNEPSDLTFTAPDASAVLVDRVAPTIVSVTPPDLGRYETGNDLNFIVVFSEPVDINVASQNPYIELQIGSNTRRALPVSGTNSDTYIFTYKVQATDTDPDLISYVSKQIYTSTAGYIRDAGANVLSPRTFTDDISDIEIDEVLPTLSASATSGVYVASAEGNNRITIDVTFSEKVTVDTTSGTPEIELQLDTGIVKAIYDSALSNDTIKRFKYDIDPDNDMDLDGIEIVGSGIISNGAKFLDRLGNEPASLNFTLNLSGIKVAPHAIVWTKGGQLNQSGFTTKPTVTTNAPLAGQYRQFTQDVTKLELSSPVTIDTMYIAMRAPSDPALLPQNFIGTSGVLADAGAGVVRFDIDNVFHSDLSLGQPSILQINPSVPLSIDGDGFIHTQFSGEIGEILIFTNELKNNQPAVVHDYLNAAY